MLQNLSMEKILASEEYSKQLQSLARDNKEV